MAIEDFFTDKCDIYHGIAGLTTGDYAIKRKTFTYPETPEIPACACKFHIKSDSDGYTQTEPRNMYGGNQKLSLPAGTDVRENDKVVNQRTGLEYVAGIPQPIGTHHVIVMLRRPEQGQAR